MASIREEYLPASRSLAEFPYSSQVQRRSVLERIQRWPQWRVAFILLCVGTLCAAALVYFMSLTSYLSVEGDNAIYIILAKALATGQGYTDIQNPQPLVEAQYPPIFPLLLAPIIHFWGTAGVLQMQALVSTFALASFVAAFFLFRQWLGSAILAFAIVVATASSDLIWSFSHKVLTEIPYLFFSLLACWWATRYVSEERWLTRAGTLAALATAAAFLTRTIGVSLCMALPLYLLLAPPVRLRDGWWALRVAKLLWTGAILVVICGGWTLRNRLVYTGQGRNYLEQFGLKQTYVPEAGKIGIDPGFLLGRMGNAIDYYSGVYLRMLGGHIWDHVPPGGDVSQALLAITVLGFVYALIRRRTIAEFYVAAYVCIVLVWPWTDLRFAVPILPFLVYYLASALLVPMVVLARWRPIDPCVAAAMALIPLCLPTGVHTLHTAIHDRQVGYHYEIERLGEWPAYADWRDFHAAAMWLEQNAVPGATIVDRSPNIFYLWTGLKSRNYPYSWDRSYVMSDLGKEHNDYVIDDDFQWTYTTGNYLEPVIRQFKSRFFGPFPIHDAHNTKVYQVINAP
jgi:hypothetical protein